MSTIAINVTKLNLADKLQKGQAIITKSTANPSVPGNATVLAEFATAQADLNAAINTEVAARLAVPSAMTARETALETWMDRLNMLASFTETATDGDAQAIESAGFAVRARPTPTQPLPAPENVLAKTNGSPGNTKLSWNALTGALTYIVQRSPDPITETGWTTVAMPTRARCETDGVEPGKLYWFRVAGVNPVGQGPWSAPACREVM